MKTLDLFLDLFISIHAWSDTKRKHVNRFTVNCMLDSLSSTKF